MEGDEFAAWLHREGVRLPDTDALKAAPTLTLAFVTAALDSGDDTLSAALKAIEEASPALLRAALIHSAAVLTTVLELLAEANGTTPERVVEEWAKLANNPNM